MELSGPEPLGDNPSTPGFCTRDQCVLLWPWTEDASVSRQSGDECLHFLLEVREACIGFVLFCPHRAETGIGFGLLCLHRMHLSNHVFETRPKFATGIREEGGIDSAVDVDDAGGHRLCNSDGSTTVVDGRGVDRDGIGSLEIRGDGDDHGLESFLRKNPNGNHTVNRRTHHIGWSGERVFQPGGHRAPPAGLKRGKVDPEIRIAADATDDLVERSREEFLECSVGADLSPDTRMEDIVVDHGLCQTPKTVGGVELAP